MNKYKRDRKFERHAFFIVLLITFALFFLLEKWGEAKYVVAHSPENFENLEDQIEYIGYYKSFTDSLYVYEYTDKDTEVEYIIIICHDSISITPKLSKIH